jgi:ribosomal protein S18 acetylase RimI-like enzyme
MHAPFSVESARPEDLAAAFRLMFQQTPAVDLDARVTNALNLVERGELDPAGVVVARQDNQLVGAMVCLRVPGASGLVWPPQTLSSGVQRAVEDGLVRFASDWLRGHGAKLGQALLTPADVHRGAALARNGFIHITSLWYLRHRPDWTADWFSSPEQLKFRSYREIDPAPFHETMLRTYEATRDCPEVNGVRSLNEIVEGHQAQGTFDPDRWWLAWHGGRPVGVLLMTDMPEWDSWDVSYVGVVPEARQRGFGRELMRKALLEARTAEVRQLTLSVDARNQPAWNLYHQLGFESFDQREVFLAVWR